MSSYSDLKVKYETELKKVRQIVRVLTFNYEIGEDEHYDMVDGDPLSLCHFCKRPYVVHMWDEMNKRSTFRSCKHAHCREIKIIWKEMQNVRQQKRLATLEKKKKRGRKLNKTV